MKRMLDQKTIDELQVLLSKISYDQEGLLLLYGAVIDDGNVEGNLYFLNGLTQLLDYDENPLFPLENNAGKVLAVNEDEDGLEAKSIFELYTHSFDELDPTLKAIVDDAINDALVDGVACSQAQWGVIKALLDKSLFLYYESYVITRNIVGGEDSQFVFGGHITTQFGATLYLSYDSENTLLYGLFDEL